MNDMDSYLDKAEEALKVFIKAKHEADDAETRFKHMTAAKIKAYHNSAGSFAKAEKEVLASDEWVDGQIEVNKLKAVEAYRKGQLEAAIRRYEAARSEYSATKRVT